MNERDRLIALLYVLMRDHLPTGVLENAMDIVRGCLDPEKVVDGLTVGTFRTSAYSVPELAQYAGRLADEILTGRMDIRPLPASVSKDASRRAGLFSQDWNVQGTGENESHEKIQVGDISPARPLQGPIEVGQRFIWEPDIPASWALVEVTRVQTIEGDETRIWTKGLAGFHVPEQVWNEESRFREACIRSNALP